MSNIPQARLLVSRVISFINDGEARRILKEALALMTREKYIRHARLVSQEITPEMKRRVRKLSKDLNLTETDIARRTGLRNAGRVSEILNGKR